MAKKQKKSKKEKPQEENTHMYPDKNPLPGFRKLQAIAFYKGWKKEK